MRPGACGKAGSRQTFSEAASSLMTGIPSDRTEGEWREAVAIADTSGQDVLLTPKSRTRRALLAAVAAVAVTALTVWIVVPGLQRWSQAEASVVRERLRLATVARGDFVRDVSVQGRVVAAVSPTLYATQDGTITFFVEAGGPRADEHPARDCRQPRDQ